MQKSRLPGARWLLRTVLLLALPGGLAWGRPSAAPASLDEVEKGIDQTALAARSLESVLGPAGGRLLESEALKRFQDAVYLNLIGQFQPAAEQFFVLVTTRSLETLGLEGDAEWYLAESLFGMGSYDVAESRYLAISGIQGHPFRKDAVRRLLEIYAKDADPSRFERLYQAEVATGLISADDLILYGIAKAFWSRGETAKAKSYFAEIKEGSSFWARAQYFIGAMLVEPATAGDAAAMDAAEPVFQKLAAIAPATSEDRAVRDLALLALARIQFERGRLDDAILTYQRVPDDSANRADKLHELAWTYIKLGRLNEAVAAVDTFLTAYPQHPFAAELNLVRGHLLFETGDLADAHTAYDKVVAEYAPIRDRFQRLARSTDRSEAWVKQVMAMEAGGDAGDDALPGYAVSLMQQDPDLSRAIGLFRELEGQDSSLDVSESLIQQIGTAVGSTEDDAEGLKALHVSSGVAYADGLERYADLLDAEGAWLKDAGTGDSAAPLASVSTRLKGVREAIKGLQADFAAVRDQSGIGRGAAASASTRAEVEGRLQAIRGELAALPATASAEDRAELELRVGEQERILGALTTEEQAARAVGRIPDLMAKAQSWRERLDELSRDLASLRVPLAIDVEMDPTVARFESLHRLVGVALERISRSESMLAEGTESHLYRVREVLKIEIEAVKVERGDLSVRYGEAEAVAGGIVRSNLEKLASRFAASVLGADMGVVNVYWSELVQMGDEVEAVESERSAKLQELDRRYGYLERKSGGRKP